MKMPLVDVRDVVSQCVDIDAEIIISADDLARLGNSSFTGIPKAAFNDLRKSTNLVRERAGHHVNKLVRGVLNFFSHENPNNDTPAVLVAPGYFGPNHYMEYLVRSFQWPII